MNVASVRALGQIGLVPKDESLWGHKNYGRGDTLTAGLCPPFFYSTINACSSPTGIV